jgi:hypothetical protein
VLKVLPLYTYISFAINVVVKNTDPRILLGAGRRGLDVDFVKCSRDYFAYLCIPSGETTRNQKRMLVFVSISPSKQNVETNNKNEPWQLDRAAARGRLLLFIEASFSNWVSVLAQDIDTQVSWARCFSDFQDACSSLVLSYIIVKGVQPRRKRDFHGRSGGTFLRDYSALPRQRELSFGVAHVSFFTCTHLWEYCKKITQTNGAL